MPPEELSPEVYAAALAQAYVIASLIKGLPLDVMERMVTTAKLAAPLATSRELRAHKWRFDRDALVVERLNQIRVALDVLLPDLAPAKCGRAALGGASVDKGAPHAAES